MKPEVIAHVGRVYLRYYLLYPEDGESYHTLEIGDYETDYDKPWYRSYVLNEYFDPSDLSLRMATTEKELFTMICEYEQRLLNDAAARAIHEAQAWGAEWKAQLS